MHITPTDGRVQGPTIDLAADEPAPPAIPSDCHQAYCIGVTAAQQDTDISEIFYAAALYWPLSDIRVWCELVSCMSLGYWSTSFRAEPGRDHDEPH